MMKPYSFAWLANIIYIALRPEINDGLMNSKKVAKLNQVLDMSIAKLTGFGMRKAEVETVFFFS